MSSLLLYNAFAVAMTLLGGMLPFSKALMSRQALWRLFALRSGLLLSITFIEIFPDAWAYDVEMAGWGALAGFGLLFALETAAMGDSCGEYLEECSTHYLGWAALVALCLHSLIDGFNLAVSFAAGGLAGHAVGLALALHKVADGFTLATLFREGGFSKRGSGLAVLGVALATPAGALLFTAGLSGMSAPMAGGLLGFAAGSFLYIGAADILPRIHKHPDRLSPALFAAGLLGVGLVKHLTH